MRKSFIAIIILLTLAFYASAFSLKEWRASLYRQIETEAEKSFSQIFQRPVSIQRAGGIVAGQIELYSVTVPGVGRAEKVILDFNPLKYLYKKGDMVPALNKITVVNGSFSIERDRQGRFNLASLLPQPGAAAGPAFQGVILIQNCRVKYSDQLGFHNTPRPFYALIETLSGRAVLKEKNRGTFDFSFKAPEAGRLQGHFDPDSGSYELNLSAKKLDLEKWANYGLPLPDPKMLGGTADLLLRISPSRRKNFPVSLSGNFSFHEGTLFGQKFNGASSFTFNNNLLSVKADRLKLYHGYSSIKASIDFSSQLPQLDARADFRSINLTELAQNYPGVEGYSDGRVEISGPFSQLSGKIAASLSRAFVLGQPMQTLSSVFKFKDGELWLDDFRAAAGDAFLSARGKISRDQIIRLQADAGGIRISGKGLPGKLRARVEKFSGEVSWKMGPVFFSAPLRHITASGEVILTEGQIGEQFFDRAEGKVRFGNGEMQFTDTFLQRGGSILKVDGTAGIGFPTRLKISGEKLYLEDLKIVNHFLPPEARDPTGPVALEIEITGALSAETELTSLAPLLALSAKGKLDLLGISLANIPVQKTQLNFTWQDHALSIPKFKLDLPDSNLAFELKYQEGGPINAQLSGVVDLAPFRPFTVKYGKINGLAGFIVNLKDQDLAASFRINAFRFNNLYLDNISGSVNYAQNQLDITRPISFVSGTDIYTLSGKVNLNPDDIFDSGADLEFKFAQVDLAAAYRLFEILRGETLRRLALSGNEKAVAVDLSNAALPSLQSFLHQDNILLYSANGKKDYFLKSWGAIRKEFEQSVVTASEENLGGTLSGGIRLSGQFRDPQGKLELQVDQGYFRSLAFDSFSALARLKNGKVKIEKALLNKGQGVLSARGEYDFGKDLFLHLTANNFPLDVLQLFLPGKDFKGLFNMNASLDGALQNPKVSFAATGKDVSLAGIDFDRVTLSLTKKGDRLFLHELSLLQDNLLSSAQGSIPLAPNGQFDFEANLKGDAVGIINLFTDEIHWRKGDSTLSAKIQGAFNRPKIFGKILLSNGDIYVRSLASGINQLQGEAYINNNLLEIKSLTGIWSGERTHGWKNPLGMAGTIDLSNLLDEKSRIDLNLAFSPAHLSLAFPGLYTGGIRIRDFSLRGPFYFDFSQGPLLSGYVEADNSVITLSQAGSSGKAFPLNFDLQADLSRNVYATLGDVTTLNLSNIFMNVEIAGEGLRLSGNLEAPRLLGKVSIKRGAINIFNREFALLSPENQKKYFPYDPEKIRDNVAVFRGEEGAAGALPDIDITSTVNVENQEKDAGGQYVKKKVVVLARLAGILGAAEKERGIKINLTSFTEDQAKTPPEFIPAAYSEQDLKVMLLPDFIKSLAGIGQPGATTSVDTNVVVADYLSSRMQTLLFRSLEREAEQKLGLESLTLEYNFGPSIREAMGVKEIRGFEQDKPAWSVGFVKGFFDRLFVDVRYAQGMEQTAGRAATTTFNYQLTYKITSIWSIIYYREPVNLNEITTGHQKVTLKAGFSLW